MRNALLLAAWFASATAFADDSGRFERQVPADARGEVVISDVRGEVTIEGWDRPQVAVQAEYESNVKRIDVRSEHGRTVIQAVVPDLVGHAADARLHVSVPRGSVLEVTTVTADVQISGVDGAQRLHTVSGAIKAGIASAPVEIQTVSGDLKLTGRGQPGTLRVSTVSGDVRLEHGAGDLEATTISGNLHLELEPARNVRLHTTSGDLSFKGRLQRGSIFEAETISGDLTAQARADAGYSYEIATWSGDIDNCFGATAQSESHSGHRLAGVRGEGGAQVRIKTLSGDVDLCDH